MVAIGIYTLILFSGLYFIRKFQIKQILEREEKERLKDLALLKTKLYNNITHEFRTPLTVIMGMVEQLAADGKHLTTENKRDAKSIAELLGKIEDTTHLVLRNSRDLLRLADQMLDLAKMDKRKQAIQWQLGDVVIFLNYIVESFHSYAIAKNIEFSFATEIDLLEMDFDSDKLQHIIVNLVSNAFKFTPPGGRIGFLVREISTKAEEKPGALEIVISNSGIGISAEDVTHVFDRFFQANQVGVDGKPLATKGTGIGLALTKDLVELMGGQIRVESNAGEDTAFIVHLPIHRDSELGIDFSTLDQEKRGPRAKVDGLAFENPISDDIPLLLLIEDNADVATYILNCLGDKYKFLLAANGQLGIERALERIPDVIISDVMMPEKDGFEVCRTLKNNMLTSHIPIVLLTARIDVESRLEGLSVGADAYLSKPFLKEELFIRMEKLLELRRNLKDRYAGGGPDILIKSTTSGPPTLDGLFLQKIKDLIEANLDDASFGNIQLAHAMALSESQLFRKLKALTGRSTAIHIRGIRLLKAKELLLDPGLTVSEIAYKTGFNDPSYFARTFSKEFGKTPTEFRK